MQGCNVDANLANSFDNICSPSGRTDARWVPHDPPLPGVRGHRGLGCVGFGASSKNPLCGSCSGRGVGAPRKMEKDGLECGAVADVNSVGAESAASSGNRLQNSAPGGRTKRSRRMQSRNSTHEFGGRPSARTVGRTIGRTGGAGARAGRRTGGRAGVRAERAPDMSKNDCKCTGSRHDKKNCIHTGSSRGKKRLYT